MDTICALASAPGRAGVAIIRVSGPAAFAACQALAGSLPLPGTHRLRWLRNGDGARIDQALVLTFDAPGSFTGEDVVELHIHGSLAATRAVEAALLSQPGVRAAEAGEFTRRALQNNRLDLTQVEGLADLIDAETEAQLTQALRTAAGDFSQQIEDLRRDLVRAAALIEATIDFVDEDVPADVTPEVTHLIGRAHSQIKSFLDGAAAAERIRVGFEVAIVGPPNIGKSSLLNRLAGRDAAITSDIAGTTRDVIEVRMEIAGLPVTMLDTAGIRESDDAVEVIGIDRARQRADAADLRVFLVERDGAPSMAPQLGDIVRIGKDDKGMNNGLSALTGQGIDQLLHRIGEVLQNRVAGAGLASRARHVGALQAAGSALEMSSDFASRGPDVYELAAAELRSAIQHLEVLVGRVGVEDLLDNIFLSFCIGK